MKDNENKVQKAEPVDKKQTNKINFFKKIWYSISKPRKYEDMREEGIVTSIKYFFAILGILALIVAIFATIVQVSVVKNAISYLDQILPEIKFKENTLSIENGEATILDEDRFKDYFGTIAVINPLIEKDNAIKEYNNLTTEKYNVVVFLSNKYIVIKNTYNPESGTEDGIETHEYKDESSKYIKDTTAEYTKESVISYLKESTPVSYYIAQYFTYYFLAIGIIYMLYILLISTSLWLVTKISKRKWTFKNSVMNVIYSCTSSIIFYVAYMIISYYAKIRIPFVDVITIAIIFIYLFILLYKDRVNAIKEDATDEKR